MFVLQLFIYLFFWCRWNVEMPAIIAKSISILSDAGLGMAMFSLGQYICVETHFDQKNKFSVLTLLFSVFTL